MMKFKFGSLILSFLATAIVPAFPAQQTEPQASQSTTASEKLSPEIITEHQKLQRLLPAETKAEITRLTPIFQKDVIHAKPGTDLRNLASLPIRKEYPKATPHQAASLIFELIAQSLGAPRDSSTDVSKEQLLTLQLTMDERAKLEDILSNLLKILRDTSDSTIQNIK
jgi:hypothetical protein